MLISYNIFRMTSQFNSGRRATMRQIQIDQKNVQGINAIRGQYYLFGQRMNFCSYVIDGLMIDTGPSKAYSVIAPFVKQTKPTCIFLTHHHEDHVGNATSISKQLDIPVFVGEKTVEALKNMVIPFYRKISWGTFATIPTKIVHSQIKTENHQFQVIHTPGHTEDHYCLYEPDQGWLFSGDLFLGVKLKYAIRGESILKLMDSIRKVLNLSFDTCLCGHAGVVSNAYSLMQKKLDYLENLQGEVRYYANQGKSAREIAKLLLPENKSREFFSMGELSPIHLVSSFMDEKISVLK